MGAMRFRPSTLLLLGLPALVAALAPACDTPTESNCTAVACGPGAGGAGGAGGAIGSGGSGETGGGEEGCGCRLAGSERSDTGYAALALLSLAALARRARLARR